MLLPSVSLTGISALQLAQVDDNWKPPRLPLHAAALQELVDAMLQVRVDMRPLPAELLAFPIFRCGIYLRGFEIWLLR